MTQAERDDYIMFLSDLANRLMHIPVIHGTNQRDVDDLLALARALKVKEAP